MRQHRTVATAMRQRSIILAGCATQLPQHIELAVSRRDLLTHLEAIAQARLFVI
jgi:hypothetical protein